MSFAFTCNILHGPINKPAVHDNCMASPVIDFKSQLHELLNPNDRLHWPLPTLLRSHTGYVHVCTLCTQLSANDRSLLTSVRALCLGLVTTHERGLLVDYGSQSETEPFGRPFLMFRHIVVFVICENSTHINTILKMSIVVRF